MSRLAMHATTPRRGAFTLIELMIVVSIIGILSTTAIPAFEKYITKARSTEALVGIKGFSDAQAANFFASGRFVTLAPPGFAALPKGGETFKDPVYPQNDRSWALLGTPFPNGGTYRYAYMSAAGYVDNTGADYTTGGSDALIDNGVQNFQPFDRDGQVYSILTHDGDGCTFIIDFDGFNIGQVNGEDWVLMIAGADFKDSNPELCSMYIMSMAHRNNQMFKSPVIMLNRGE